MNQERNIQPELRKKIEEVAQQYRRVRAMRGLAHFGLVTFALTCLFTLIFSVFGAYPEAPTVILGVYLLCLFAAFIVTLVRPMFRPVSLRQVALYIDEHHPELENRIISAIDFTSEQHEEASDWLVEQFLVETLPRVRKTRLSNLFSSRDSLRSRLSFGALMVSSIVVIGMFNQLWLPSIGFVLPEEVVKRLAALPFTVDPGNVKVRRGDNQMILVKTENTTRAITIRWREGNGVWQEEEAAQSSSENVRFRQFTNIQNDIQYQVELDHKRSDVYQISMWIPPEIESINLTYNYPEYTQMAPREEPNGGNITALEGTRVDVAVVANKPLSGANMYFGSGEYIVLESEDNIVWTTPVTVEKNDTYRIELTDMEDDMSEYNPEYKIASIRDKAPEIDIDFPRGDNDVSLLEEVAFDFSVTDDFGFSEYGIQYEIAGRDPVRVSLNEGTELQQASEGRHDIALEDLNLEVGDFITWTVWAKDTNPARGEYEELGDPFFFEIRPFKMVYSEAISGAGSGGGGGGGGAGGDELAKIQRDILISTWNLRRESKYMDEEEFEEKRGIIVETQESLVGRVSENAGPVAPPEVQLLLDAMRRSVTSLNQAVLPEPKKELSEATTHQQMSSRLIAKLKGREAQVQQQQQQGGGGGGGGGGEQPDISELEMARNKNFYEEENATREQQEQTDAVLERIKELAHRQQGINEELAKLISELQTATKEEEKEDIERKLAQLEEQLKENLERVDEARRELSSESLTNEQTREARENLENARHQMERALEQMERDELQKARTAGARAMNALEDMQQSLQQFSREMAAKRMEELMEQMSQLQQDQNSIVAQTNESFEEHENPNMDRADEMEANKADILRRKDELSESFVDMMNEASELAERGQQTQELMSRKLGDWLRETAGEGIVEDIEESQDLVRYDIWESALDEELAIAEKIGEAKDKLAKVASSVANDELEGMQKALGHLDELMESEAMRAARAGEEGENQEARARGTSGEEGDQEGQQSEDGEGRAPGEGEEQGQSGEQGQEGQEGEQGQSAQAGQEGEQGQSGEQGQDGQQGEQGEGEGQGSGEGQGREQVAQQQGSQNQGGQQSGSPQGGSNFGGNQNGGASNGGGYDNLMQDFAQEQYRTWLEELRNAESLLPEDSPTRQRVTRIRESVESMRRDWRNRARLPEFDLFLEVTARPLIDATAQLQREIQKELDENEFVLVDDGDIPERYKGRVAQYFKDLSEAETKESR